MIKVTGKTLAKVQTSDSTLERVDGAVVAKAIGAQVGETLGSKNQGPVALFGLRQALARRLRSTGGRPSLGVSRRQKIPLDDSDWDLLCRLSEMLADDTSRPTPGQVASELLRERLHQVHDEIEQAEHDPNSARLLRERLSSG